MAFLDKLLGIDDIEKQRRRADRVAREQFDPNVLNPQLEFAKELATEGVFDDEIRNQAVTSIFSRTNVPDQARNVSSGRELAFVDKLNEARTRQLGQFEEEMALREERAKRQGRQKSAEIESQREQIKNQRLAQLTQNKIVAEAEANKRRRAFAGSLIKLGGAAFGPAGAAIGGAVGGAVTGAPLSSALLGGVSSFAGEVGTGERSGGALRGLLGDRPAQNASDAAFRSPIDKLFGLNLPEEAGDFTEREKSILDQMLQKRLEQQEQSSLF